MCGRFTSTQIDADLVRAFRAEEVVGEQLAPPTTSPPPNRYGQFSNGHRARSPMGKPQRRGSPCRQSMLE